MKTTMNDSFTLSLSGTCSVLESFYFPPIQLSPNKNYCLGLVELLTFNSIPNIDEGNNKFHYGDDVEKIITIPTGNYEIEDIEKYLQKQLHNENTSFSVRADNNTLTTKVKCTKSINFAAKDSIGSMLGFHQRILAANETHQSDRPVSIIHVNSLRVECNITTGAYVNGERVHTIHEFFPSVPPGYKIMEVPAHVIYLPITVQSIDHLQLRIVDQDGRAVNFRGEVITIRLHIKII